MTEGNQAAPAPAQQYSVGIDQAKEFAKVWHHNGVNIILQDSHYKFATDFANVALQSFIRMCQQQMATAVAAAKAAQAAKVTL